MSKAKTTGKVKAAPKVEKEGVYIKGVDPIDTPDKSEHTTDTEAPPVHIIEGSPETQNKQSGDFLHHL